MTAEYNYSASYGPIPGSFVTIDVSYDEEMGGMLVTVLDGIEVVARFPLDDVRDARIISRLFLDPFGKIDPYSHIREKLA